MVDNSIQISRENESLLLSLHTFYGFPSSNEPSENMKIILPYLNGTAKIAIRYIDWFVTNYAKKYHISYNRINSVTQKEELYDVYSDYRGLLKGYKKHTFDPFCRDANVPKIPFKYTKTDFIYTTFGQLNFYKWAIQNDVLKYVENNYEVIKQDLDETNKNKHSETLSSKSLTLSSTSTDKKRKELSENSYKAMYVNKKGGTLMLSI